MNVQRLLSALGALLFAAVPLAAQNPGTIAGLEFQTPKNGMATQYESGRKTKAAWHKQQNDPQPLLVWETLSGEGTGTYIVGRLGQHWADFDKPPIPEQTDIEEYNKEVGQYVGSLVTRYYEFLPKVSSMGEGTAPSKFSEIIEFHVRYGKAEEFQAALGRIFDATQKTKWPVKFGWYELANGGLAGTFVLVLPHDNWADFGDNPNVKPFREMLKDAFGQAEADAIVSEIDSSVESEMSSIIQFRPDLSYTLGK
jgi:hypothetical protein